MKIEKGKLYLDTDSGTLFKADITSDNYDNFASDKISVNCPTKEDYDYIRNILGDVNHNRPYVFINEEYGLYRDYKDYHIITIEEFKKYYP